MLLVICAILSAINSQCFGIQILLDNETTARTQFCVGESLTLVCNGNTGVYQWRVGSIITNNDLQVSPGTNTTLVMGFTATYVNMTESRLQFVIPADFENNTVFTCRDVVNNVDVSSTTLLLHGDPTAPNITSIMPDVQGNHVVFILEVERPAENFECVSGYVVTVNGIYTTEISIASTSLTETITVNTSEVAGTKPCESNHTFTVRASNSNDMSNNLTGFFDYNTIRYLFTYDIMEDDNMIKITIPPSLTNCIIGYEYTYLGSTNMFTGLQPINGIPLDKFVNRTICDNCYATIRPIIKLGTILNDSAFQVNLNFATTPMPTDTSTDTTTPTQSNIPLIAGVAGGVGGFILILLLVAIIGVFIFICKPCKSKSDGESPLYPGKGTSVESGESSLQNKGDNSEILPTYQDPASIKHQTASQSGDVYTVPQKKPKKGHANSGRNEEVPMYSMVDKSAKQQEGLVYADIDVKNPVKPRSRPPAPPGVTEHDPMEQVVYSVVQK